VFEEHKKSCGYAPMMCGRCETKFIRSGMEIHKKECLEEEVECSAVGIGCDFKGKRRDLKEHVVGCVIVKMHKSLIQMQQQSDDKIKDLTEKLQQYENNIKCLTEMLHFHHKKHLEWDTRKNPGLTVSGTKVKCNSNRCLPRNILVKDIIRGNSRVTFRLLDKSGCHEAVGIISRSEFRSIEEIQKWVWLTNPESPCSVSPTRKNLISNYPLPSGSLISIVINTLEQVAMVLLNGILVDSYQKVVGTDLQFVATLCCSSHLEICE